MKAPRNKTEALDLLNSLRMDFEALRTGEWVPDDDSIDASDEVLVALMEYVEELK